MLNSLFVCVVDNYLPSLRSWLSGEGEGRGGEGELERAHGRGGEWGERGRGEGREGEII